MCERRRIRNKAPLYVLSRKQGHANSSLLVEMAWRCLAYTWLVFWQPQGHTLASHVRTDICKPAYLLLRIYFSLDYVYHVSFLSLRYIPIQQSYLLTCCVSPRSKFTDREFPFQITALSSGPKKGETYITGLTIPPDSIPFKNSNSIVLFLNQVKHIVEPTIKVYIRKALVGE